MSRNSLIHFLISCFAFGLLLNPPLVAAPITKEINSSSSSSEKQGKKRSGKSSSKKKAPIQAGVTAGQAKKTSRSKKAKTQVIRGQRSIEPSRVKEIQSALAAAGFYKETPNGQWDDSTSKAMSAFQQQNGYKVTGKPDALSLKKLGL